MSGTCHLLPGIHSGPSLMRVWAGWFVGWCSFAGRVLDFRLVVSAMCTVMVEACRIEDIAWRRGKKWSVRSKPAWRKIAVYQKASDACSLGVWGSWQGSHWFLSKQWWSAGRGIREWYNNHRCFYGHCKVRLPLQELLPCHYCWIVSWCSKSLNPSNVLPEKWFLTSVQLTRDGYGSLASDHGYLVVIKQLEDGGARKRWGKRDSSGGRTDQWTWSLELCASGQVTCSVPQFPHR